ncbi:DCC1-like thiol-disulfide oxidoreductase family protein [Pedobacter sp. B4-66]|uniref:DCC1-like thiol-disulfide oxidoreductase family protein n=1 Tax=Pedobacter sp. B4-66 TaxID=2817280 RepID=UPI001BD99B87|nr:DCC1-like thiol-disulfide oxidoreductase family protein [Pedobacter sp. B4-66]
MFKKIYQSFRSLYNKKIDGKGLAIFRIAFSIVMFGEVIQLFCFRHLIFDKIPYLIPGEIEMWPVFLFWLAALLFLVFGLFTRIASIVNYVMAVIVIGTISSFEYHMFYTYLTVSFLFMFLPISRSLSFDRLIVKLKYSNTRFRFNPPNTVSVLSYYLIILLGIGFVYFDSVFFKFDSKLWIHGLGLWLPGSLPEAVIHNNSLLLNSKPLVIGLGYLTLIFETIFLFVFWIKKLRFLVMIIGIGLHLGILIFFPIPFFALGVVAIYLLMIPTSWWDKLFHKKKDSIKLIKFYYDAECPLCVRTRIILEHLDSKNRIEFLTIQENYLNEPTLKGIEFDMLLNDIYSVDMKGRVYNGLDTYIKIFNTIWYLKPVSLALRIPGIYHACKVIYRHIAINRTVERCTDDNCGYVAPTVPVSEDRIKILNNFTVKDLKVGLAFFSILTISLFQLIVTYNSPLSKSFRNAIGISDNPIIKVSEKISNRMGEISKTFLGVTHHGVFVDAHFAGYNHSIAIVYIDSKGLEKWLPVIDKAGMPGPYLVGPIWAKWTFRVNGPLINQQKLTDGLRDFTAFWANKNSINLKNAVFKIKVKKNLEPTRWEYDFLKKQLGNSWLDGGTVKWENNTFSANLKVIENM